MKELKNDRDVLQALLDGETIVEIYNNKDNLITWHMENNKVLTTSRFTAIPVYHDSLQIKKRTININGYEVPEPLREEPAIHAKYYSPLYFDIPISNEWDGVDSELLALKQGLIHLTEEAALLHRKALASFTTQEKEGINENI